MHTIYNEFQFEYLVASSDRNTKVSRRQHTITGKLTRGQTHVGGLNTRYIDSQTYKMRDMPAPDQYVSNYWRELLRASDEDFPKLDATCSTTFVFNDRLGFIMCFYLRVAIR